MEGKVKRGCRVAVPFGQKKTYTALVVNVHDNPPSGDYKIKEISELLDENPAVTTEQFNLWSWIAQYYLCSVGDVFKAALPAKMKVPELTKSRRKKEDSLFVTTIEDIEKNISTLNEYQEKAYNEINSSFTKKDITLLHGVTSSGKTELYIHLIIKNIKEGKQVLYLLPEIALTTQITERLKSIFGDRIGVYHSKFSDNERSRIYQKQLSEEPYDVILGVRSSVFLPFKNLGLVIVDEEHETSYKQQDPAPRYHARSCAIMLAKQYGAKTLLGTATPSIETYDLAQKGRYGYVALTHRYKDLQLPEIEIVDIRRLKHQKRLKSAFSQTLIDAIQEALDNKEQIILFQNRRGFSNFIQCKNCGWVPHCEHCDVSLTYHQKSNILSCHYCGKNYLLPIKCPQCEEQEFVYLGLGTEKIEEQIHKLFPQATTSRMDLDTAHTRKAYEEIINDFSDHKCDILIGTQMVTKGLDFDNVSVVGILDADTMLNLPDFRSFERSFHTMAQVAGRAGRKNHRGRVIIQTRTADSQIIKHVVENDYEGMYKDETEERELFSYPPFCRLIYMFIKHRDAEKIDHCAFEIASELVKIFGDRILGPDKPAVSRIKSMALRKIVIKIKPEDSTMKVRQVLRQIQEKAQNNPNYSGMTIYYDADPM